MDRRNNDLDIEMLQLDERKLREIDAELAPKLAERAVVEKRVALRRELLALSDGQPDDVSLSTPTQAGLDNTQQHSITLVEAVPKVLRDHGPLKPSEIRSRLSSVGFTQSYNDNYFYTVISRLSKSGAIIRTPDKKLAVPTPQEASSSNEAMH